MFTPVAVLVLIFVATFAGGAIASARWLPPLALGRVGGLAFFAVCGLLGMSLALIGVHVYEIVRQVDQFAPGLGVKKQDLVASDLETTLRDTGPVLGLAIAVYLLGPGEDEPGGVEPKAAD
jgi:hypothetical protein